MEPIFFQIGTTAAHAHGVQTMKALVIQFCIHLSILRLIVSSAKTLTGGVVLAHHVQAAILFSRPEFLNHSPVACILLKT